MLFGSIGLKAQCPLILNFTNQDVVGCEGDAFIFSIQFDDDDLATINWTLPDGTTSSELSLGYSFESPDGCNDVQTIAYDVVCTDGTVLDSGSFTVSVFTYNEAIVEIDQCTYTVMADCPQDVLIVGGNNGGGQFIAEPGDMGVVPFEISNPGAPDECNINSFNYNYNCFLTGLEEVEASWSLVRLDDQLLIQNFGSRQVFDLIEIYNVSGQRLWRQENLTLNPGSNLLPFELRHQAYLFSAQSQSARWSQIF